MSGLEEFDASMISRFAYVTTILYTDARSHNVLSPTTPTAERTAENNLLDVVVEMIIRYIQSGTILVFDAIVSATAMPH